MYTYDEMMQWEFAANVLSLVLLPVKDTNGLESTMQFIAMDTM